MDNAVQDIKDRMSIEDLVGQYVELKKVGRNFKGLCPFHSEKTPSFVVSPERQIAYCFGCNKGGDLFSFIQEVEGCDFNDALKILAEKTGVELDRYQSDKPKLTGNQKELLLKAYETTTKFYEDMLWNSNDGAKVLDYLRNRGLTDESIKLFRVGFAPDSFDKTHTYLNNKGYTKKLLVSAGLAMTKETTMEKVYDRFRGRLMFPIRDNLGRIVAFGGRALSKEQEPKYLNSAESAIYHKSNILYGFFHSKKGMKEWGEVMVVEGYMDVIASFQAGVKAVVAPCGTALVDRQVRLLKTQVDVLNFSFDSDFAGLEAAKRAYETTQEFGMTVKMVVLPEGKDPAEYAKNHDDLVEVVSKAELYSEYYYKRLLTVYGTEDLSAKKKILQEIIPFFRHLKSSIEKDEYVRRLAHDLDIKEVQIYDEIKNFKLPQYHPARVHNSIDSDEGRKRGVSREASEILLGLLLEFPRVGKIFVEKLNEDFFADNLKPIYKAFVDQYNNQGFESERDIIGELPHELKENAALITLYVSEKYGEITEEAVEHEMAALIENIRRNMLNKERLVLQKRLIDAEKSDDKGVKEEILKELTLLNTKVEG